jgi:uncharacterized protein YjbI with pentapeptide repeats
VLGRYLINNKLSKEILEFLEYKIKSIKKRNYLKSNFYTIKDTFGLMLQNGMTYYIDKHSKNVLEEEINIFINMLEILHLWKINILRLNPAIHHYIKCNRTECLNLENIYLYSANLTRVNLIRANLKGTNLVEAILTKADLTGADLTGANLAEVNLAGAELIDTIFDINQIRLLKKKYNLEKIKVYIEKGIIISYHEYKKSFMIK